MVPQLLYQLIYLLYHQYLYLGNNVPASCGNVPELVQPWLEVVMLTIVMFELIKD